MSNVNFPSALGNGATVAAAPGHGPHDKSELWRSVRAHHRRALRGSRRSLDSVNECGTLLLAAKPNFAHGTFEPFLQTFRGQPSVRVAQQYMQIAANWPLVAERARTEPYFGIQAALRFLAKRSDKSAPAPEGCAPGADPDCPVQALARQVLGEIDCCPQAESVADLSTLWSGRVFLAPPKGRATQVWITKLRQQYPGDVTAAVVLVSARTNAPVFAELAEVASCLAFWKANGAAAAPLNGPAIVAYLGDRVATFAEVFEDQAVLLFPRP